MIKLIACDIDGTLVDEGSSTLDPELCQLIKGLKIKGVQFVAASGRQFESMRHLFEEVQRDILYISENGGYACSLEQDLAVFTIDKEYVHEIVTKARQIKGCEVLLCCKDKSYADDHDPAYISHLRDSYKLILEAVPDVLKVNDDFVNVSIHDNLNVYENSGPIMEPLWKDKVQVSIASSEWIDFTAKNVNKGTALKMIQEKLHILPEETMAFGNGFNDIGLFQAAEESYAVESAPDGVKKYAKYIVDDHQKRGVINVLKRLLNEETP